MKIKYFRTYFRYGKWSIFLNKDFGNNNFNNSNNNTNNMFINEGNIQEFVGRDKIVHVNTNFGNIVKNPNRYYVKEIPTKAIGITSLITGLFSFYKGITPLLDHLKTEFHFNFGAKTGNAVNDFLNSRLSSLSSSSDITEGKYQLTVSSVIFFVVAGISMIIFLTLFRLSFINNGERIEKIGPNLFLESGSKKFMRRIYLTRFKTECEYCSRNNIQGSELKIKWFSFNNQKLYWKCDEEMKHNIPFDRSVYGRLA